MLEFLGLSFEVLVGGNVCDGGEFGLQLLLDRGLIEVDMLVELGGLLVVDRGDLGEEGGLFSWVFDGVVVVVEVGLPEQLQFVKDISLHILF